MKARHLIGAKEDQKGATYGTQTMLSILEKRGPKAYGLFVKVLRNPEDRLDDLADEIEAEERKLRGKPGIGIFCGSIHVEHNRNFKLQSRHVSLLDSFIFADFSCSQKRLDSCQNIF